MLGSSAIDTIYPDDRPLIAEKIESVLKNGNSEIVIGRVLVRGGPDYKWLVMTGMRSITNGQTYLVGIGVDISEQKRAEEKLAESEERFKRVLYASNDAILLISDNSFVDCNDATAKMLGYENKNDFLMSHPSELSPLFQPDGRDSREKANDMIRTALTRGFHRFEWTHRQSNGEDFPVEVSLTPILYQGKEMLYCVWRDITEIKRVQESFEKNRRFLEEIIENSGSLIYVKDCEGRYQLVNKMWSELLGIGRATTIGSKDSDLFSREEAERFRANDLSVMSSRRLIEVEEALEIAGLKKYFNTVKFPLFAEDGTVNGVCGMSTDITQRKQAAIEKEQLQEQLLQAQKMDAIGQLAGGVAHDFNNMLSVIIGYVEMILSSDKFKIPDTLESNLLEIKKAASRSAELTSQLLAFARKQTIIPKILDLNETIGGMVKMLKRLIGENIALEWLPSKDMLWTVKMDPTQINQILANLAINARDAISGPGILRISTANLSLDPDDFIQTEIPMGDYVLLAVHDNGCGMGKEILQHIFEPFFTTKEIGKGTGLGLPTVYGIVKQNNGGIEVESEPGKGTIFRIYLPRAENEENIAEPDDFSPPSQGGGNETILIVEDEESILKMAVTILEFFGYKVFSSASPFDALEIARRHPEIKLLVSDVVMPGMNGKELLSQISEICPEIKVLFMSGYTADIISSQGAVNEDYIFMEKPFSVDEISNKIREALDS